METSEVKWLVDQGGSGASDAMLDFRPEPSDTARLSRLSELPPPRPGVHRPGTHSPPGPGLVPTRTPSPPPVDADPACHPRLSAALQRRLRGLHADARGRAGGAPRRARGHPARGSPRPDYELRRDTDPLNPRVQLWVVNVAGSRGRYRHEGVDHRFGEVLGEVGPDIVHGGHLNHLSTSLLQETTNRRL